MLYFRLIKNELSDYFGGSFSIYERSTIRWSLFGIDEVGIPKELMGFAPYNELKHLKDHQADTRSPRLFIDTTLGR
jgi:hypothetical protein